METKESKIIQMRKKANQDFRINRPYGVRLNMKSKSYALFNRELNVLGKAERSDLNTLPSEPYECIEDIPLGLAQTICKDGDIVDLFFYDEQEGYSSFHKKDRTVQIHPVSYMIYP